MIFACLGGFSNRHAPAEDKIIVWITCSSLGETFVVDCKLYMALGESLVKGWSEPVTYFCQSALYKLDLEWQ